MLFYTCMVCSSSVVSSRQCVKKYSELNSRQCVKKYSEGKYKTSCRCGRFQRTNGAAYCNVQDNIDLQNAFKQ